MKQIILTFCAATLLLLACNNDKTSETKTDATSDKASTESADKPKAWVPIDSAMMEKAWKESMAITEHHKMLAKASGTWNADVTMWMAAGAPPMKSTATTVNTMIFGGLYQQSKHNGNMMGAPFEGISTTAYDNVAKEYVSTWIDNMGTGIMKLDGTYDPATKSVTYIGKQLDPMLNKETTIRQVFKYVDDKHQVMEMYMPGKDGKEYKGMEIHFTKK